MHTRRSILLSSSGLLALALTGCAGTAQAQTILITQTAVTDAENVMAGLLALSSGTSLGVSYTGPLLVALAALGPIQKAVGQAVPITSVGTFFADAEKAAQIAADALPGNADVQAISIVLPVLAAAWGLASMLTIKPAPVQNTALPHAFTLAWARARLAALPRPPR